MHYLSICSGSFQLSSADPNLLTSKKIDSTCVRKNAGYIFTISDILRRELHASVVGIADEVTQASYYTAPWIALWLTGIIAAFLELLIFLPLTWHGTRRLNGYSFLTALISYASFQVASGLASGHSLKAYHSKTLPSALYSTEFFAMSWTTSALMFVVFVLVQIEWRFELWTLKGELITMYRKPPSKSWLLLNAYADRNPTKIDGTGRGEEYEMQ